MATEQNEKTTRAEIAVLSAIQNLDAHGLSDGEPESSRVTARGTILEKEGAVMLSYVEEGEGGKTECKITLFSDGHARVIRHGAVEADFLFIEGKTEKTVYAVPPYRFDAVLKTDRIRMGERDGYREAAFFYHLTVGGAPKACRLTILYKKV